MTRFEKRFKKLGVGLGTRLILGSYFKILLEEHAPDPLQQVRPDVCIAFYFLHTQILAIPNGMCNEHLRAGATYNSAD